MLASSPTELSTAATDAILGLLTLGCILPIRRIHTTCVGQKRIWIAMFGSLSAASILGAITHGLIVPPALHSFLWSLLYASLGLAIALFTAAAARDFIGKPLPIRWFLLLGIVFWFGTIVFPDSFLIFIVYEAAGLLVSLAAYLKLTHDRRDGAGAISLSIVISLFAAIVQSIPSAGLHLIGQFDHNGLFHLIQMPGIVILTIGIRRMLASDSVAS